MQWRGERVSPYSFRSQIQYYKVRDIFDGGDYLVLVTTDQKREFDRVLSSILFKGQGLGVICRDENGSCLESRAFSLCCNSAIGAEASAVTEALVIGTDEEFLSCEILFNSKIMQWPS